MILKGLDLLKSNTSYISKDISIQCVLLQNMLVEQQILQYNEYSID